SSRYLILNGGFLMFSQRDLRNMIAAAAIALASGTTVHAADPVTLTSPTVKDGEMRPTTVANNLPNSPNGVAQDVAPQCARTGPLDGRKGFAILMEDPEGRGGAGVHHWVAYGIPASVTSFAEGEVSKPSDKYVGGKSTQGVGYFSGPCTPPGTPHHYTFVVIATHSAPNEFPPGPTRQ